MDACAVLVAIDKLLCWCVSVKGVCFFFSPSPFARLRKDSGSKCFPLAHPFTTTPVSVACAIAIRCGTIRCASFVVLHSLFLSTSAGERPAGLADGDYRPLLNMEPYPPTSTLLETLGVTSMVTAANKRKRRRSHSRSSSFSSTRRRRGGGELKPSRKRRSRSASDSRTSPRNGGRKPHRANEEVRHGNDGGGKSTLCVEAVRSIEDEARGRGATKNGQDQVAQRVASWMATADSFGSDPDTKKTLMEGVREILLGSRLSGGRPSKSGIEDLCALLKSSVPPSSAAAAELTGPLDLLDQCMLRALVSRNYSQLIVFWYVLGAILATFVSNPDALSFIESLIPHFVESYLGWIRPIVTASDRPAGDDEEIAAVAAKVRRMLPMFEMWRHCLSTGTMEIVRRHTRSGY